MSSDCDEQPVGIARIDCHLRNLLAVAQAEMRPRGSGIGGLVDAVANGEVRTMQPFAAAYVNNLRIRGRHNNRANGPGWLLIEDRLPGAAVVGRLPHTPVHRADVEDIGLAGDTAQGASASATKRANVAPAHFGERLGVDVLSLRGSDDGERKQHTEYGKFCTHGHPHNLIWAISPAASCAGTAKCSLIEPNLQV